VKWAWNNAQQQAFNDIKQKVGMSQIFTNPLKGKPFCLCPDASDYAVGWWSSTEKECFAVVHFMNH